MSLSATVFMGRNPIFERGVQGYSGVADWQMVGEVIARALMANPLVRNWEVAKPLLDALLEANVAHLPRFAVV